MKVLKKQQLQAESYSKWPNTLTFIFSSCYIITNVWPLPYSQEATAAELHRFDVVEFYPGCTFIPKGFYSGDQPGNFGLFGKSVNHCRVTKNNV